MQTSKTLFYSERDYLRAVQTLEQLKHHVLWNFAIVGGIANRALFPEWAERNKSRKFNDIDIVLLPTEADAETAPLSPTIKNDFYITYIHEPPRFFGVINRSQYVYADIFTTVRPIEIQTMDLEGQTYNVLTAEERYLSMARDIYETLQREWLLDPKHIEFLEFLNERVNFSKILEIWPMEAPAIDRNEVYPFDTFESYLNQIQTLLNDKKDFIKLKIPGTEIRPYKVARTEAFGITLENEADYYKAYEQNRKMMED